MRGYVLLQLLINVDVTIDEYLLTPLPLVPHIYASVNWVSIGSDNGLSPIRCQAII